MVLVGVLLMMVMVMTYVVFDVCLWFMLMYRLVGLVWLVVMVWLVLMVRFWVVCTVLV